MSESERQPSDVPPDPSGIEEPHDVLAAEEFGIGTRHERVPADPSGIREPHDVLAADEFPMPATSDAPVEEGGGFEEPGGFDPRTLAPLILLVAMLALIVLRRRR